MPANLLYPDHDILASVGDGSYDISFFAASVAHSVDISKRVFQIMSGESLSKRWPQWDAMSAEDKRAFLLERHEMAHHALLFSTPAGGLIWRLNQVISRDASFLLLNCDEMNITFDGLDSPRAKFADSRWRASFLQAANTKEECGRRKYVLAVFEAMEKLVKFKSILFSKGIHTDLVVSEFLDLANFVYRYLQDRCETAFVTKWKSRRSDNDKLFTSKEKYNIYDIAECHAICMELFALRALSAVVGYEERVKQAIEGPFGLAFNTGAKHAATQGEYGFSPYFVMVAALNSMSGAIDTISPDSPNERYIEDEFPWHRFAVGGSQSTAVLTSSIENLMAWERQPLFGAGSNWLRFDNWHHLHGLERIKSLVATAASLALDLQVYSMHEGALLNVRFLATILGEGERGGSPLAVDALSPGKWINETLLSIHMIEYDDGLLFTGLDLDQVYKQDHPLRQMRAFDSMKSPAFQLMGHIVNGTLARSNFARFYHRQIPKIGILKPKLRQHFEDHGLAETLCDFLETVFENSVKSTLFVTRKRYI